MTELKGQKAEQNCGCATGAGCRCNPCNCKNCSCWKSTEPGVPAAAGAPTS